MTVELRPAREDDLERLVEIHAAAFPDPRSREARLRNFRANPLGELGDLHVAAEDGGVVGHAFLFPLRAWFGGACVRAGGVASVAVAPEARARGVGSAIVERLHELARDRGDAVTILYAFRQAFYSRLGYAPTTAAQRLRFHPASVPDWRSPQTRVRAARGEDREAIASLRDDVARKRTGMLARTLRHWDALLAEERTTWLVAESAQSGGLGGYLAFSLEQTQAHAKTTLRVHEVAARTPEAERALWGAVGRQRAQVAEVHAEVPLDHPLASALVDADRASFGDALVEHVLGEISGGPMVRVVDVPRALEARGWALDGTLLLDVGGDRLVLTVRGGRAETSPPPGNGPADLVVPGTRELAVIAYGGLSLASAERLGMARLRRETRATTEAMFAAPPYHSPDPF